MKIEVILFDDQYQNFDGKDDFVIPFVPKFLLLENVVCEVAKTHEPLKVIRKELIESWIEMGIRIRNFPIPKKPTNYKLEKKCQLSLEESSHIKLKITKNYSVIYNACNNICLN